MGNVSIIAERLSVSKHFGFEAAHRISGHQGACANIHGHSYKLIVTATGLSPAVLNPLGMIVDFKDLSRLVKEHIIDVCDHALILWAGDSMYTSLANSSITLPETGVGTKICAFPRNPTAENMAKEFHTVLNGNLRLAGTYYIRSVTVYETESSFATYEIERKGP